MGGKNARRECVGNNDRSAALVELLAWYCEMGASEAVGDAPIAWLARGDRVGVGLPDPGATLPAPQLREAPPGKPPAPSPPSPLPPPLVPGRQPLAAAAPDQAVMAARMAARQAANLDELAASLARFEGCGLKATAKNLCFYRGLPRARLMLIGEAPGREEDLEGKPFVGPAGQLLDKMLAAIGLSERHAHITNIVYWRPPGNRTPTPQEALVCRPFLERQIELVAPDLIVLLGGAAAKHLLEVSEGIMRIRGKLREVAIGACKLRAMATLHPAYLLRTPAAKRLAWRDLLAIKAALGSDPGPSRAPHATP